MIFKRNIIRRHRSFTILRSTTSKVVLRVSKLQLAQKDMQRVQLNLHASSNHPIKYFVDSLDSADVRIKVKHGNHKTTLKVVSRENYFVVEDDTNGHIFNDDEFITFQIDATPPLDLKIELLHKIDCVALGYVTTDQLKGCGGWVTTNLLSTNTQTLIASITFEYCVIDSFNQTDIINGPSFSPDSHLLIGHRGSGMTKKNRSLPVLENTMESFNKAYRNGAQFVEFDIQLTKDRVPIVFHDFYATVLTQKEDHQHDLLRVALKDMTFEQVKKLKLDFDRPDAGSHYDDRFKSLCPTLKEVIYGLPTEVGVLIELKYPYQCQKTGEWEIEHFFSKNTIVDCILHDVLQYKGGRPIVFCSFDPEICLMLQYKQNRYKVFFDTVGENVTYRYMDVRNRSGEIAVNFVLLNDLAGVSISGDEFYNDRDKLQQLQSSLRKRNKLLYTYGEKNSDPEYVKFQKSIGVAGVITDSIEEVKDS